MSENCSRDGLVLESRELVDAQESNKGIQIPMASPGRKGNTPPMPELVLLRHQTGLQQALVCQCQAKWVVELWLKNLRVTVNYALSTDAGRQQKLETLGSRGRVRNDWLGN